ncbi:hypothetical protein ILUMI_21742, partial [Ignelater luminosus]
TSKSTKYQQHLPYSIGYYLYCSYNKSLSFYKSYTGRDCLQWYANELFQIAARLHPYFEAVVPMTPLNVLQEEEFKNATTCHICERSIMPHHIKVRDHCHFTGRYRGCAHNSCNLNYKTPKTIPVIFHNLSGYDSHFLIKDIAQSFSGSMYILPINKEKYISFTKTVAEKGNLKFRFIDSYRFLNFPLDVLASSLP